LRTKQRGTQRPTAHFATAGEGGTHVLPPAASNFYHLKDSAGTLQEGDPHSVENADTTGPSTTGHED
jgi:hypothetical protein